jgi:hypothetical protein
MCDALYRGTTSSILQAPAFITDGDPATRWLSSSDAADPAAQWAYVDLGGTKSVDAITIVWGILFATAFRIQTSTNLAADSPWQDTSSGAVAGTEGTQTVAFARRAQA